jgi:hypothetical protein
LTVMGLTRETSQVEPSGRSPMGFRHRAARSRRNIRTVNVSSLGSRGRAVSIAQALQIAHLESSPPGASRRGTVCR